MRQSSGIAGLRRTLGQGIFGLMYRSPWVMYAPFHSRSSRYGSRETLEAAARSVRDRSTGRSTLPGPTGQDGTGAALEELARE
jgi:hypothetical protein